jgi:mercuric ion transport protein
MSNPNPETIRPQGALNLQGTSEEAGVQRQRILAVGGILGALVASACCVLPFALLSLGLGGAWIAQLSVLTPYKPSFEAVTGAVLGWGFYLTYWKTRSDCAADATCSHRVSNRFLRLALWTAAILLVVALAFDYVEPLLLGG